MGFDDSYDLLSIKSEKELGNYLKEHRKKANISLEEIQKQTKIRTKYLKALESGDFSIIPGGDVYVKGFLQNYAKAVGLETSEVLDIYKKLKGESFAEEQTIKSLDDEYEHTNDKIPSVMNKISPKTIVSIIIIFAIVIVIFFSIRLFKHTPSNTSPTSMKNGQNIETEQKDMQKNFDEENEQNVEDESDIIEDEDTENKVEVYVKEDTKKKTVYEINDDSINVVLEVVDDRCWINVKNDGDFEYEGIMSTGDSKEFNADEELVIRIGNPLVVKLKVNNKDLGILGGQARDVIFIKRGA